MYEIFFLADGNDGKSYRIVAVYKETEYGSGRYMQPEFRLDYYCGETLHYNEKEDIYTLKASGLVLKKKPIKKRA